jgi:hypothetical protein
VRPAHHDRFGVPDLGDEFAFAVLVAHGDGVAQGAVGQGLHLGPQLHVAALVDQGQNIAAADQGHVVQVGLVDDLAGAHGPHGAQAEAPPVPGLAAQVGRVLAHEGDLVGGQLVARVDGPRGAGHAEPLVQEHRGAVLAHGDLGGVDLAQQQRHPPRAEAPGHVGRQRVLGVAEKHLRGQTEIAQGDLPAHARHPGRQRLGDQGAQLGLAQQPPPALDHQRPRHHAQLGQVAQVEAQQAGHLVARYVLLLAVPGRGRPQGRGGQGPPVLLGQVAHGAGDVAKEHSLASGHGRRGHRQAPRGLDGPGVGHRKQQHGQERGGRAQDGQPGGEAPEPVHGHAALQAGHVLSSPA